MKKNIGIFLTIILSSTLLFGCAKKSQPVNNVVTADNKTVESKIETKPEDKVTSTQEVTTPKTEEPKTETTEQKPIEKKDTTTKTNTTSNSAKSPSKPAPTNPTPAPTPQLPTYSYSGYTLQENSLDNTRVSWYFKRNTTFTRPSGAKTSDFLKQYGAYYIGDNRKVIYLSFDEGNLATYSAQNMDTLKRHGIKATFFVTKPFIDSHPDLVQRMVNEGHTVGNHSVNHLNMNTLASGDNIVNFIKEIADTENRFKEVTGRNMTKIFRYPEGAFSQKTLSFTKAMGYRSYFWSFAYKDWEENCNTKEQSLEWMKNYYHNGAIYLLHGINKGNADALDDFITFMQSQGYTFDLLTNIQ